MRKLLFVSALLFTALMLAGCSGGNPPAKVGVIVKGKVLKGGQPLTVEKTPPGEVPAEVVFMPLFPDGERESQGLKPDGTFEEIGQEKGIKPGKYRLAVLHFVKGRGSDGLNGAFSEQASPIEVEIPADKSGGTFELPTIELDTYKPK